MSQATGKYAVKFDKPLADVEHIADVQAVYLGGRRVGPSAEYALLPGISTVALSPADRPH